MTRGVMAMVPVLVKVVEFVETEVVIAYLMKVTVALFSI